MKILIFGGDGMLAYALRQVLSFEKVVPLSKMTCDITDIQKVDRYISNTEPNWVINCAAHTNVDEAENQPWSCELINARGVQILAQLCRTRKVPLVHFSTEMVFGQEELDGYTENVKPKTPLNVYGRRKLEGEEYLQKEWEHHYLVRTSWMFGPNHVAGENRRLNFVDKILHLAKVDKELTVVSNQWGCPTYTFDVARELYKMMCEEAPFGIYHLVNEGQVNRANFAEEIVKLAGLKDVVINKVPSNQMITPARRPIVGVLHNTRRPPLRQWREALKEYLVGLGEIGR